MDVSVVKSWPQMCWLELHPHDPHVWRRENSHKLSSDLYKHTCAHHTHKHKKKSFITHVCLPSSLSLISEKLMLEWQNKRQEGKWITTQDVKSLVVRLNESKGRKSTILSLHFHHFCKRSYNLTSASSIPVPWLYPTPHSLWALVSSISSFDHFNILCRLQPQSFTF